MVTYGVVEQLLQLFVGIVDTQLFKAVKIKNLKSSNIQDTNETSTLSLGSVQRPVNPSHNPLKQPFIGCLGECFNSKLNLFKTLEDIISLLYYLLYHYITFSRKVIFLPASIRSIPPGLHFALLLLLLFLLFLLLLGSL
jgi:hypothetical protein